LFKAIIFDLGKVIVPFEIQRGYAALQPHCGFPAEELPQRIAATGIVHLFEEGRISSEDFVRQFSEALGLKIGYVRFCELWSSIFLPDPLVPEELLEGLRRRYRLLLLSNTNAIHFAMLRDNYPILRHFDDFILSYEVGAMKPDPRIYQAAIERAGCRPEECFFTDDMAPFVEAARRAGIDAVQFQSAEQVERELLARGIEWRAEKDESVERTPHQK
jgi:putative hydrolase of the HAD superfamily